MFRMDYDVEDDAFAYPGFHVGGRLLKPQQAVHFHPVQDLRIGTLIQADPHKGVELRLEEGSNYTKYGVFVGDKFLVPPGLERVFLTNRSNTTSSIFVLVTIYAASQPVTKKVKVESKTKKQDDATPVSGIMQYKGQGMYIVSLVDTFFLLNTHEPSITLFIFFQQMSSGVVLAIFHYQKLLRR